MTPENLESQINRFHKIVDRAISLLLRRGPTDLEAVCRAVEESSSGLIERIRPALGDRQIRIMVGRRLKRTHIELPEALRRAAAEANQAEFDFHDIEEFRGVTDSLTYEDRPGHVTYIHYLDTTKKTRRAAREFLSGSIDADLNRLHALDAANDHADQLTEQLGGDEDTSLRSVLERWFNDQNAEEFGA